MAKPDFKTLMREGGSLKGFEWPETCGSFDMRIATDGTWFYQGSPIGRKALCQLFATVLQKDDQGNYWLVTPVERGQIMVDDAPFLIVEMEVKHKDTKKQLIRFRTNLDHWVTLDADHPLRVELRGERQEPTPYVLLWDQLEAKLNRSVFYQLVDLALEQTPSTADENQEALVIYSAGQSFKAA